MNQDQYQNEDYPTNPPQDPTIVLTPECTLLYPELFEPTLYGTDPVPKYRCTLLFDPGEDMKPFREACRQAAHKKFGAGVNIQSLRFPVRDGNDLAIDKETKKQDPTNFYYNRTFIRTKSNFNVPIVNVYNEEIKEEEEIYAGCVVRVYLKFNGYAHPMGDGVSTYLKAVCKIRDGEPLGGGKTNTGEVFKDFIKPKDTFMDQPPGQPEDKLQNELGQQNRITNDPGWRYEKHQPQREPGDEEIPF